MLQFVGEVGIYLPEQDAIAFTALDGRTVVACRVARSAFVTLGYDPGAFPDEFRRIGRAFIQSFTETPWI